MISYTTLGSKICTMIDSPNKSAEKKLVGWNIPVIMDEFVSITNNTFQKLNIINLNCQSLRAKCDDMYTTL